MTVADDYSPIYVGDLAPPLSVQFSNRDGTAINLTGATFSLVMESSIGTRKTGTGTWTINNATAGQASYAWSSADVSTAGTWTLQVAITVNGLTQHCDPKALEIDTTL